MNEHPGVRPVLIRPETTPDHTTRSLPRGTTEMPVGLSANAVGLGDGRSAHLRRLLIINVSLIVVIVLSVGSWLFVRSLAPLSTKTLVNGLYEYSFLFYKDAEPVNLVAGQGFKYDDKAIIIAKTTTDDIITSCSQLNTKKTHWDEAFRAQVAGVERPVCHLNNTVFVLNFYSPNQSKHLLEVSYTIPRVENMADVRKMVESVKVVLE